jgi:hypothetical protein
MTWLIQKSKGSALLMVLLVSGFLLAVFASYSTSLRSGLRSVSGLDRFVQHDDAFRSAITTGMGVTAPNEWNLDGAWEFMIFSGSSTPIKWVKSGLLTITRSGGTAFCYSGLDGAISLSGCAREGVNLSLTSNTGTLQTRTLGKWTRLTVSPNTQVISPNIRYMIFEPVGNLLLPTTQLSTSY